ncbi:transcriptional regulator, IclR family [Desulforamulus putei DSM 12395]|uniref:Glycerol operon regulatory protein n=1 Tax=Desulforamulus putei DSM 12395 TaxID=1121429 RepID=A0A1M5CKF1_9FIRM|nr:IclR family transcriptional regulator [Desulforamulus putei]SHF54892.1 transcriptional regulator, IclR family [Desulforamulus putei DSM 12395]
MKKKTNIIQSVDRAISILEVLEKSLEPLGVTEISNRLDLHKSTTFGLLNTLESKGLVYQEPENGKYKLGLRLLQLGEQVHQRMNLRQQAHPFLKRLVDEFKETVHLVLKVEDDYVYIDKVDGPQAIRMYSQIGKRALMHCTGVGKSILAFLPEDERERILAKLELKSFTPSTITNIDKLRIHLKEIKKQGYSIDDEEIEMGLRCVAAPVLNHRGEAIAAISIAGPSTRMTYERIQELIQPIKETALSISKSIGYLS